MLTEVGVSGKMRLGKMAVGLRPEIVTIHHNAEPACPARVMKRQNPTLTEVGVPGRIRQLETVSLGSENVTILHSVELASPARENQLGKVKNVLQVIRASYHSFKFNRFIFSERELGDLGRLGNL